MTTRFHPAPEFRDYAQVPVTRRRWFFVLSLLFFIPAGIYLALSGPVYALRKGQVAQFSRGHLQMTAIGFGCLMAFNIARLLLH